MLKKFKKETKKTLKSYKLRVKREIKPDETRRHVLRNLILIKTEKRRLLGCPWGMKIVAKDWAVRLVQENNIEIRGATGIST